MNKTWRYFRAFKFKNSTWIIWFEKGADKKWKAWYKFSIYKQARDIH